MMNVKVNDIYKNIKLAIDKLSEIIIIQNTVLLMLIVYNFG